MVNALELIQSGVDRSIVVQMLKNNHIELSTRQVSKIRYAVSHGLTSPLISGLSKMDIMISSEVLNDAVNSRKSFIECQLLKKEIVDQYKEWEACHKNAAAYLEASGLITVDLSEEETNIDTVMASKDLYDNRLLEAAKTLRLLLNKYETLTGKKYLLPAVWSKFNNKSDPRKKRK